MINAVQVHDGKLNFKILKWRWGRWRESLGYSLRHIVRIFALQSSTFLFWSQAQKFNFVKQNYTRRRRLDCALVW